ncbi:YqaA family protein [uncultured Neptuniibacter sp.]|uniref:YqaA family protein n=1 Tax=uncultured Neptuniibacter sp. TaxID=502143 RepID=UPI00262257A9|nr:YqaA family protein [uncultured Neptuniibacter sp.]
MSEELSLGALFLSGFISATLLPGGSEVLLAWQLIDGSHNPWALWAAVTSGNALGGIVTFLMGWGIAHYFPLKLFSSSRQLQAKSWLERYGAYSLLLSWLPLIGDPLCFMAGWLKTHFLLSLLMITLGKAIRYLLIIGLI